jgi:PAS domain S-box-containing protein
LIRIVYVDDEPGLLEIGKLFLEWDGQFSVDTFTSAFDCLSHLTSENYDAIISDYQMPDMNGIEFLKKIRSSGNTIPFILFTGRGREEVVIQALNEGADFYLQKGGAAKPQFAELAHKVHQAVKQKLAEKALRESETQLRATLESTTDGILAVDNSGKVLQISPQFARIWHIPPHIIEHNDDKALQDFVLNQLTDPDAVLRKVKSLYGSDAADTDTLTLRDGRVIERHSFPMIMDGARIGRVWSFREVTERKQAEEALRESQEELSTILNAAQVGIVLIDAESHTILRANPKALSLIGASESDVAGTICHTFICPTQRGKCPVTDLGHDINASERVLLTKNGKKIPIIKTVVLTQIGNRKVLVESFFDITDLKEAEQKLLQKNEEIHTAFEQLTSAEEELRQNYDKLSKNEQALRESEEMFRALVEHSLDSIVITDFTGTILFANRTTGLIVDRTDYEALIGRNVLEFVDPVSKADMHRDFSIAAMGVDAYLVHYKIITETKREIWVECIGKKIQFRNTAAMLISIRDVTKRRRDEELLRESENKFATVFRSSPVALTLVSATDGTFVDVNDAFLASTGYSLDEVIGRTPKALGIFVDRNEHEKLASAIKEKQRVFGLELKCRTKTGEIQTCLFSSGIILMGGKPHILSTVENVTERKAAEISFQAMVRTMAVTTGINSLQKITENVSTWLGAECVMVGEIQPDRETVKVVSMLLDGREISDFSYKLKGTPCEDVEKMGFCFYPDNVIQLFPESRDLVELNIRGYIGTSLQNSAGQVIGILCALFRNPVKVTPSQQEIMSIIAVKAAAELESTRMMAALRDSEERFRMLLQQVPTVAVQGYRMDGTTHYWNKASENIYGYTAEEANGRNLVELIIPPEMREDVRGAMKYMAESGQPIPASELSLMRKNGSRVEVFSSHAIVKTAQCERELFCIDIDLTERKQVEKALRQANKKLNLLSGITRHDISNQLMALQSYLSMIKMKQPGSPQDKYYLKIASAAERISAMIRFTKEYESIGVTAPVWQECRALVDNAAKGIPLGKTTVENDLPAGLEIYADPLIVKVCYNLIDNAVQYGGKITTIRFSGEERNGDHIVICEDDGDGVLMDEKELIFERGFGKNTGLGLALSREILDITGVTIRETGEPGKGARFELTIPKAASRFA